MLFIQDAALLEALAFFVGFHSFEVGWVGYKASRRPMCAVP